jgi:hypothetical protein
VKRSRLAAALALVAASSAPARPASLDGRSLRIGAGLVRPEALPTTPWIFVAFALRLGPMSLEPETGYWSRREVAFGLENAVRDVHAGLSLTWSPLQLGRARLLGGAGASAHSVTSSGGPVAGERASETNVRPGVQAWAAIEVRLSPRSALFAAARSDWILRRELPDERESRLYGGIRLAY